MRNRARAAGLVLGVLADRVFGDPVRGHPVAAFGTVAAALERRLYRDDVAAGAAHTLLLTGAATALGALAHPSPRCGPLMQQSNHPPARCGPLTLRGAHPPARCGPLTQQSNHPPARCGPLMLRGAHPPARCGPLSPEGRRAASWWGEVLVVAVATWAVLGGTSLVREGVALGRSLEAGDLPAARARIPHLCARDPELLDAAGMARAGVESLAENTSDAVVAPLFWGAVAGVPGLLGYRAVNTLDAMVGYRSARYERFGRVAARLDDLANLAPARLTAVLTVLLAPAVGGRPADALRAWRRDASGHPSPNAGPVEATAAGALGLRLGGRTEYAHGAEDRPTLGDGRAPEAADLAGAARLSRLLGASATLVAAALTLVPRRRGTGSGRGHEK